MQTTAANVMRGDKRTYAKFCRQSTHAMQIEGEETRAHMQNSADRTRGDKSTHAKFCRQNERRQEHTCKILQTE
jgi:hypothetical protein